MDVDPAAADLFANVQLYVRLISGMVLGIALARLLTGSAKIIQQTRRKPDIALQMLWALSIFIGMLNFWWSEANSFANVAWDYYLYLFQILHCCMYLLMCALLFPEDLDEYDSYFDYLVSRRFWFFGAVLAGYLLGLVDVVVKEGMAGLQWYLESWYINLFVVAPLLVGMAFKSRVPHYGAAAFMAAVMLGNLAGLL